MKFVLNKETAFLMVKIKTKVNKYLRIQTQYKFFCQQRNANRKKRTNFQSILAAMFTLIAFEHKSEKNSVDRNRNICFKSFECV